MLSGDGWRRDPVFDCGRCCQVVQQSGGSCVLIQASFWLDTAHREDADTRFIASVSQAGMGFASFLVCYSWLRFLPWSYQCGICT